MRFLALSALLAATFFAESAAAEPDHATTDLDPPVLVAKLRFEGPLWTLGYTNSRRFVQLSNNYIGLELFGWVGLEVGGGYTFHIEGAEGHGRARLGIVPWIVDNRHADGRGFSLQLDVYGAYAYQEIKAAGDGYEYDQINHIVGGDVGLDFNFRVSSTFGLAVRPMLTMGGVVSGGEPNVHDYAGIARTDWVLTAGHSFGVLF